MVARDADRLARGRADAAIGAEWVAADVTDPEVDERIVATCAEQMGGIDVLVNNAGTSFARPLEELTDEDWQAQWELHVMAPMRLMRAAAPRMAARGGGRIVNVTSSSGKRPSLTNAAYSVTKAAQLSLSRVFADRFAADGVLVNAVAPGAGGLRAVDRAGRAGRAGGRGARRHAGGGARGAGEPRSRSDVSPSPPRSPT